ncbi:S9 family peptidase [Salinispora sp. H7-4]|uniref:alpha/beta hydrolase family protein n=1 Tax=Salinispora sp. H7-4 TaxID=2748321 RepID=UPI0015D15095|nr:prolyl oligopeptidase family serine peptidase [Salinispora sp. H7-4]NYT92339.1 S9 family peptidase [Salinispora sp. H7-4]
MTVHIPYAPAFAAQRPDRSVEVCVDNGLTQVLAWDRRTDQRQVRTTVPNGVAGYDIEPDGRHLWWFDADPAGIGLWRRQPFRPTPTDPTTPPAALTGLPPGRQTGIAFDASGSRVAVGIGTETETRCYVGRPGGAGQLVAAAAGYATLVDLTADGDTVALAGRADSDTAISVIRLSDGQLNVVAGSDNRRIWALEFRPGDRSHPQLLVIVETPEGYRVGTWQPDRGIAPAAALSYDTEVTAHWYGTDGKVLIQHDHAGRSRLLLADLTSGEPATIATPPGTILDLTCAPGGDIHYVWTGGSVPPQRRVAELGAAARAAPRAAGPAQPTGTARRSELWTTQPYGRIHSFLATPPGAGPWPTLFLVHGGPSLHDRDAYDPRVELLVRAGYAVVRTNYRGSTGYGPQWQRGYGHRVGLAQLDDLTSVRRHLLHRGVATPGRVGLCGYSWGGYLVLLAMGATPADWSVGLAVAPIADYPAAYRGTTTALREVDDELFGGGPDDVPQRYRAANPMTYLDQVRGPLFIAAASDDDRCPPGQVRRYVAALRHRRVPHQLHWMSGGHLGDAASQTRAFDELLRYAGQALGPDRTRAATADGRPYQPTSQGGR